MVLYILECQVSREFLYRLSLSQVHNSANLLRVWGLYYFICFRRLSKYFEDYDPFVLISFYLIIKIESDLAYAGLNSAHVRN